MYVYGGLVKGDSNLRMFTLNLKSQTWGVIDKSANELMPAARDDHSACSSEDTNSMFIFGGYVRGGKANDLWRYDFETNEWHELDDGDYHITNHKLLLKE